MIIALAQINTTVGDIDGNAARILRQIEAARAAGAELVIFPELTIYGYPPKDLLLRDDLVQRNVAALQRIAKACHQITAVVGYVQPSPGGSGTGMRNAAAVCRDGVVHASYAKRLLPTYDVFDETRYFDRGPDVCTFEVASGTESWRVGITICEDLWNDWQFEGRQVYHLDPVDETAAAGARLLVNLSASPFCAGKQAFRQRIFAEQMKTRQAWLAYVNQVGGNDDLIFDGGSLVLDPRGALVAQARAFEEELRIVDLAASQPSDVSPYPEPIDSMRHGLVLGLRDYIEKCGFGGVVMGLSGGIDSALTAALAVEALGPDRVHGVAMPSRYSSDHSVEDARQLAENLGISFGIIEIEGVHRAMEEAVRAPFQQASDLGSGVAEENIQARVRGNILMALSNKRGWLLLTTGNKSELAVGYCTLYGDMCGGLAVLSDVPKTVVYDLARRINDTAPRPCIPVRSIEKPPSAELREDQCDQDTLPAYDVLDGILEHYVEGETSVERIVAMGFDRATVERIARMVDLNEYKRKQAPVGLKVTSRAFGTGRRMPIAAKHR